MKATLERNSCWLDARGSRRRSTVGLGATRRGWARCLGLGGGRLGPAAGGGRGAWLGLSGGCWARLLFALGDGRLEVGVFGVGGDGRRESRGLGGVEWRWPGLGGGCWDLGVGGVGWRWPGLGGGGRLWLGLRPEEGGRSWSKGAGVCWCE